MIHGKYHLDKFLYYDQKDTKIFIQICALNEEENIAKVIKSIPRKIFDCTNIFILVVNDGSSDRTAEEAIRAGADFILDNPQRQGLARSFQKGLDACLSLGADIIVNIDADGQYLGEDIPQLIAPILEGRSDIVIGNRNADKLKHFSLTKRLLQRLGSWVVMKVSGLQIEDAVSGFRAYSREATLRLFVTNNFSYTVETIIQAAKLGLIVTTVPVSAYPTHRPSRLHQGILHFIVQQGIVLIKTYINYEPLKFFGSISILFLTIGLILLIRLALIFTERGGQLTGNIQSLVVGTVSLSIGLLILAVGILADRIRANRQLLEEILYRIRKLQINDLYNF